MTLAGGANDVWIFQISGDVDVGATRRVTLAGGAQARNIFWQVAGQVSDGGGAVQVDAGAGDLVAHGTRRLRTVGAVLLGGVANREVETETHKAALAEFRKQIGERQPALAVETGLMALDGRVEMFT